MSIDPAPGTETVPVCPRHPDRESYVRCQRCERPVCPECQRPAAVGVQCVDCVKQGAKEVRGARTIFGGAVAGTAPRVTQTIIALCALAYVAELALGGEVIGRFSFAPYAALAEPWRFLTSAFLHATSPLHILFNMYALWLTGPYLETLLGRGRFLALYLLSALGGSVFFFLLASNQDAQQWFGGAVGASGAVFGMFAALVVVNRRLGRDNGPIIGVIAINAVIGFIPGLNIAWQAHLGGLVTGALVAAVLAYAPRARRTPLQVAGVAAVLAVLGVLPLVKVGTLPLDGYPLA